MGSGDCQFIFNGKGETEKRFLKEAWRVCSNSYSSEQWTCKSKSQEPCSGGMPEEMERKVACEMLDFKTGRWGKPPREGQSLCMGDKKSHFTSR